MDRRVLHVTQRLFLVLAIAGGMVVPVFAQERLEVASSLPHGLFYLLECLREEPHHSNHLREYFLARHPLDGEELEALQAYRGMLEARWANIRLPATSTHQRALEDVLEVLAVRADTVDHFLEDARAILGPGDAAVLSRLCGLLEESYRETVWAPCQADLERQSTELQQGFHQAKAVQHLRLAARFYESRWPPGQAFLVVLTPIPRLPGQRLVSHGHSNGHLQVVEAPSGASQAHAHAVVFHELCHALYATRSAEAGEELGRWFGASPLARDQLNEGLATALGNGWFARELTGSLPEGSWYHDSYVDGYARALFPLVEDYLKRERPLDRAFALEAARVFEDQFPDAPRDPGLVLRRLLLLSVDPEDVSGPARQKLFGFGRIHSLSAAAPIDSERTRQQFSDHPEEAVVFMLSHEQLEALQGYPFTEQDLAHLERQAAPVVWAKQEGRRWLIVSLGPDGEARWEGVRRLFCAPTLKEGKL